MQYTRTSAECGINHTAQKRGKDKTMMREELRAAVAEKMGTSIENVVLHEVQKNNGKMMTGLTVRGLLGSNISPCLYVDQIISSWENGKSTDETAEEIADMFRSAVMAGGAETPEISRETVLNGAFIQVVNAEKNESQLVDMPHRKFMDLAAIVRSQVNIGLRDGLSSMKVTNQVIRTFGISEDELFEAASRNTMERFPLRFMSMAQMMAEMTGLPEEMVYGMEMPLYVVTNEQKMNGAAALYWPEKIGEFADMIGDDVYVLPSSIHEILLYPVHAGGDPIMLREMVCEINATEVAPEEVLSDNVYVYKRETRKLSAA